MTEDDYKTNIEIADAFAANIDKYGKPVKTDKLTPDQRGWVQLDWLSYLMVPGTDAVKWFILDADRPRQLQPALLNLERNRAYNEDCACDNPDYGIWGTRYDGAVLLQCEVCGEVVARVGDKIEEAA